MRREVLKRRHALDDEARVCLFVALGTAGIGFVGLLIHWLGLIQHDPVGLVYVALGYLAMWGVTSLRRLRLERGASMGCFRQAPPRRRLRPPRLTIAAGFLHAA